MSNDRVPGRVRSWLAAMADGIGRARTLGLAAEMSFWVFLALVPLAAIAGYVAARLAASHAWLAASAVPPQVRDLIAPQLEQLAGWRGGAIAPIAAATFLWLASSGVHAIFDAVEVQTGTSRPWWKKRLLAIAACLALAVGVGLLALLGAGLDRIESLLGAHLPPFLAGLGRGTGSQMVRIALGVIVAFAMVSGLYRVAIPPKCGRHFPVVPGAALAVVLQAALGWGYGVYVTRLGGGGGAYMAGLAVVGVTLMTLWLLSVALLLGAQLNRVLAERLRRDHTWPSSGESSSPQTSPRRPNGRSIGPSISRRRSEHP
jgi:membrane protein